MYKWVQQPGVVERFMKKGEGAQQMSTSFPIKVHIKYASTNAYGCYQLHNPLEILFQSSQKFPIQICSGDNDQV